MIDPTPNEQAAMAAGGDAAGAYLESLGRFDLATLSQPEWRQLIGVGVRQAAGVARPAGQAADRALRLSEPGAQPYHRRREGLEAHGGDHIRHRHGEP